MSSPLVEAVVKGFQKVSSHEEYQKKWITISDWAAIICSEYELPHEVVGELIGQVLGEAKLEQQENVHLKNVAAESRNDGEESKKADSSTVTTFLYVGNSEPKEDSPYHFLKQNQAQKYCGDSITPQVRFQLLSVLVPEIERRRGMTRTASTTAAPANTRPQNISKSNAKMPPIRAHPSFARIIPPFCIMPPLPPPVPAAKPPAPAVEENTYSLSSRSMSDRAKKMEELIGNQDQATKTQIIKMLLKRKDMEGIQERLEKEWQSPVEGAVCNGIQDFLQQHMAKGSRPKHEQDAVDAVLTAVCFSNDSHQNLTKIGQRLGIPTTKQLYAFRNRAKEMRSSNSKFQPKQRKKRSDAYREDALKCVSDFIHSEHMSRVDTRGKARVYKVKHPLNKDVVEKHPARIWNVSESIASRHQKFIQSELYTEFQKTGRTIGMELFRLGQCKCISDASSTSTEHKSPSISATADESGVYE